jgi:hypothetical protein
MSLEKTADYTHVTPTVPQAVVSAPQEIGSSPIDIVPDEMWLAIFSFLQPYELVYAALACRRFKNVAYVDSIWRAFCQVHPRFRQGQEITDARLHYSRLASIPGNFANDAFVLDANHYPEDILFAKISSGSLYIIRNFGELEIYNPETDQLISKQTLPQELHKEIPAQTSLTCFAVSTEYFAFSHERGIQIWDRNFSESFSSGTSSAIFLEFFDHRLYILKVSGQLQIWDLHQKNMTLFLELFNITRCKKVDDHTLLIVTMQGEICLWDNLTCAKKTSISTESNISDVCFDSEKNKIIVLSNISTGASNPQSRLFFYPCNEAWRSPLDYKQMIVPYCHSIHFAHSYIWLNTYFEGLYRVDATSETTFYQRRKVWHHHSIMTSLGWVNAKLFLLEEGIITLNYCVTRLETIKELEQGDDHPPAPKRQRV